MKSPICFACMMLEELRIPQGNALHEGRQKDRNQT